MRERSSADEVLQALDATMTGSRPRRAEDGSDPDVPVAATVVIARDEPGGLRVLLIERPDRGSFAGAWVFPGGKLEDADRIGHDEQGAAARAGVRETTEETGLRLDASELVPLSCWDPPPGIALRIRTWFFLAVDPGGAVTLAADEAVAAEWARPAEMLERHARGEVTLYPPTWVTLHELAGQPDIRTLIALARLSGVRRYETVARSGSAGPLLLWQGDAEYDESGRAEASASRHRLEMASLPWVYTRTE